MSVSPPTLDALAPHLARRVDQLCDRFESSWQSGRRPSLERYVQRVPPEARAPLLRELLSLDRCYRAAVEEAPGHAEYRGRFPEYAGLIDSVFREGTVTQQPAPPQLPGALPRGYPHSSDRLTVLAEQPRHYAERTTPLTKGLLPDAVDLAEAEAGPAAGKQPRVLGEYTLLGRLGKGGMGIVYKAKHKGTDRFVALKVIRPDRLRKLNEAARAQWLKVFREEARLAAQLEHDHIVPVYDVGEYQGRLYYAMRQVTGQCLADLVKNQPLPKAKAVAYLEPVALAVHYGHTKNVLHCDIKPRNILLDASGKPLITDYGLARVVGGAEDVRETIGPVGTYPYMAPEQSYEKAWVGVRSDVYSLGATLYELVTRRAPFHASDPAEVLRLVRDEEPVRPSVLNPEVDRDLDTIILKCLEKDPGRRYRTAKELADDLGRYQRREPIQARPLSRLEHLGRWCRRHPVRAAAAVLILMVAGLLLTVVQQVRVNAATRAEKEKTEAAHALAQRNRQEVLLQRGLSLCEQGDIRTGLHGLVQSLRVAPGANPDLEGATRANLAAWSKRLDVLQAVLPHDNEVRSLAVSPDGKTLATGTMQGTLRLWDLATGALRATPLAAPKDPVTLLTWGPGGKTLAVGTKSQLYLYETGTWKPLFSLPHPEKEGPLKALYLTSDESTLLSVSREGIVRRRDARTGSNRGNPLVTGRLALLAAFNADGSELALTSPDNTVRIWEVEPGTVRPRTLPHAHRILSVAFSPDGRKLLTGTLPPMGQPGEAILWDLATGQNVSLTHPEGGQEVAFAADGATFLTRAGGVVRVWATAGAKPVKTLVQLQDIKCVTFGPDSSVVVTGDESATVRVWRLAENHPYGPRWTPPEAVLHAVPSPDGRTILTASYNGTCLLWDRATGAQLGAPMIHPKFWIFTATFSPDGTTVLTAGEDNMACLWDARTGAPLHQFHHQKAVLAAIFSPDGKRVLTSSRDKTAQCWDPRTGQRLGPVLPHPESVRCAAFSPDGKSILTGCWDNKAYLWDATHGNLLVPPLQHEHTDGVSRVAFCPRGHYLLTAGGDTAYLWDALTGQRLGASLEHQGRIYALAFSPTGKEVASAGRDGVARVWEVPTGRALTEPLLHHATLRAVKFSPDGRTLLTAVDRPRGQARLWDIRTSQPVGPPLRMQHSANAASFGPDGKTIVVGGGLLAEGEVAFWELPGTVQGDPERLGLWVAMTTGQEVGPNGSPRELDAASWRRARDRLEALGGVQLR